MLTDEVMADEAAATEPHSNGSVDTNEENIEAQLDHMPGTMDSGGDQKHLQDTGLNNTGSLVGRAIKKLFGNKYFSGVISSFDSNSNWYKILYEDGDQEDLEETEVTSLLLPVANSSTHPSYFQEGSVHERNSKKRKGLKCGSAEKKRLKDSSSVPHDSLDTEDEERWKHGTGMTFQEGIKRYLQKLKGTRQSPINKGSKGKRERKGKTNISNLRTQHNSSSPSMKFDSNEVVETPKRQGKCLIGCPIYKKLNKQWYSGTVSAYDKRTRLYKVIYDDGDCEELQWRDLEPVLTLMLEEKNQVKEKTRKDVARLNNVKIVNKGAALVGRLTKKKFGRKFYAVTVVGYDQKSNIYKVRYENGKQEDLEWSNLEWSDVEPTLEVKQQSKRKSQAKKKNTKESTTERHGKPKRKSQAKEKNREESTTKIHGNITSSQEHALVGRKTSKCFGKKLYTGTIMSYDDKTHFYRVKYEDEDEEDLEWNELEPTLTVEC